MSTVRKQNRSSIQEPVPAGLIEQRIYYVRGHKIMLARDLADLYAVPSKALNQAVNRNRERFPDDFVFELNISELAYLRSQIVTSDRRGLRHQAYAFTEQGIAMLSSVLRSKRAIQVNIAIMRAFVKMREAMISHKDLSRRINDMERKYDGQFRVVFDALRQLMEPPPLPKKRGIGFIIREDE